MSGLTYLDGAEFGPLTRASLDRSNAQPTSSLVYFIADTAAKLVKIGKTVDLKKRLEQLQCGSANELSIVGALAGGKELEAELHERFAAQRVRGEWFRLCGELENLIYAACEAATGVPFGSGEKPRERGEWVEDDLSIRRRKRQTYDAAWMAEFEQVMGIEHQEAVRLVAKIDAEIADRKAAA